MKRRLVTFFIIILSVFSGCSAESERNDGRTVVALLDTGVSASAIGTDRLLPGYNYVTESRDTEDQINHGTAVASILLGCESASVQGAAPNAYLVPLVVVTERNGEQTAVSPDTLAQAIRDSIDLYQADLINVSLGVQKDHSALRDAVAYAERKGVPMISAVGNGGETGRPYYPAAYDTVLAVGSCDRSGKKSSFSQDGAAVLAPGEGILLASRSGNAYGIKGTSFSAGFVTAYAANLLTEEPTLPPKALYDKILEKAASCGGYLPAEAVE